MLHLRTFVAVVSLLSLAACGSGDDPGVVDFDDAQVITDFADQVVVPTYQALAARAEDLDLAIVALQTTMTAADLDAARAAWVAMRRPWEQSEGFLFGPVDAQGWDPAMDSWPLNQTDLQLVLESGDPLDADYVRALPESQKGFHAVEFLLWGQEGDKDVAALTVRELEYARALTAELVLITGDLATSWTAGVGGAAPYREALVTAGEEGNTAYPSRLAAVQEIVGGISGICDEVANGKIATPFDARDANLVESQYSFNSLTDFADNVRSVENVYLGDFPLGGRTGRGLGEWVAARNPALDTEIRGKLASALAAVSAIPEPFRDAIAAPANDAVITAAQVEIRDLQALIDGPLTDEVRGE